MKSDDRAFRVFGCRHFDLCETAGSVNNLIRQSLCDGKRVLKTTTCAGAEEVLCSAREQRRRCDVDGSL